MRHLGLYLWKEWRDQRAGVFGMIVVIPALFVFAALVWDSNRVETALHPGLSAAIGGMISSLAVGADLIPGELRRARVGFLERLPGGLERAFRAKLVFFVVVTLFAAGYAMSVASGLHALQGFGSTEPFLDAISEKFVLPAIACALWVFAVSAWVPHGALAFPAAAIVIAVLCSPAWFFFGPGSILQATSWELRAFCALSAVGAAASAWVSFVRGYRFGRSPAHAASLGAGVAMLSLLPAWSWCAWRLHAASTLDPHSTRFCIEQAWLAEDGSRIFFNATNDGQTPARDEVWRGVRVDLKSGAWQSSANQVFVEEFAPGGAGRGRRVRSMYLNGMEDRIGNAHDDMVHSVMTSTMRVPDREFPTAHELGQWRGLGYLVKDEKGRGKTLLYDPFRKRSFDSGLLYEGSPNLDRVWTCIRPGSWLIDRGLHSPREYELFDPDSRASTRPIGWKADDFLGPILDDGRFLAVDADGMCIYAPETGARQRLTVRGELAGRIRSMTEAVGTGAPFPASRPRVIRLQCLEGEALALLDLERNELSTARASCGMEQLIACESADAVLVLEDQRRIVRLRFGTADREVVFPRD